MSSAACSGCGSDCALKLFFHRYVWLYAVIRVVVVCGSLGLRTLCNQRDPMSWNKVSLKNCSGSCPWLGVSAGACNFSLFEVVSVCMFPPSCLSNNYLQKQGNETGFCVTRCQRQRQGVGRKSKLSTRLTEVDTTGRNVRICVCCFSCCALQFTAISSEQMLVWRWFFQKTSVRLIVSVKGDGRLSSTFRGRVLAYQLLGRAELTVLNSHGNPNLNMQGCQAVLRQICAFSDVCLCTI